MTIYVIQHTLTHELLEAFTDKELAEKWHEAVNYSVVRPVELKASGRIGEQTGQVFHIDVHGDPSVGLFGGIMKVTFEDNTVWDTEMTEAAKEVLSDFYDVSTKSVRTTEEQAAEDKALDKYIGDNL